MATPGPRRIFLKQIAVVASSPLAAGAAAAATAAGPRAAALPAAPHGWRFFNLKESRAIEAIVARLIPADENGPGALEAGVAVFMDLQLASAWGNGDHFYRSGPFRAGTPQQGYQLAFTPAE